MVLEHLKSYSVCKTMVERVRERHVLACILNNQIFFGNYLVLILTSNDTACACLGHEVQFIVMVTGHLLLFIEGRTVLTRMYEQNKEEVDRAVLARLKKVRKLHKTQDNHETL